MLSSMSYTLEEDAKRYMKVHKCNPAVQDKLETAKIISAEIRIANKKHWKKT